MTQTPTLADYRTWTDDEQAEFLRGRVADAIGNYVDLDRYEAALDDALEWIKEFKSLRGVECDIPKAGKVDRLADYRNLVTRVRSFAGGRGLFAQDVDSLIQAVEELLAAHERDMDRLWETNEARLHAEEALAEARREGSR